MPVGSHSLTDGVTAWLWLGLVSFSQLHVCVSLLPLSNPILTGAATLHGVTHTQECNAMRSRKPLHRAELSVPCLCTSARCLLRWRWRLSHWNAVQVSAAYAGTLLSFFAFRVAHAAAQHHSVGHAKLFNTSSANVLLSCACAIAFTLAQG